MKSFLSVLFFFSAVAAAPAQVGLSSKLIELQSEFPGGELSKTEEGYNCYSVRSPKLESALVFVFDENMNCFMCAVMPDSKKIYNNWKKLLKKSWKKTGDHSWSFMKPDGLVMSCDDVAEKDVGRILLFYYKSD
ncbi:MAG: hypothetical protein ACKOQ6_03835 [Bacteroidota bacterium]